MDIRQQLADLFKDAPVAHGIVFDDGRRWCQACNKPRTMLKSTSDSPWKGKMCHICSSIWPEYIDEFIAEIEDENVDIPDVPLN
jgi:hypothetical protein